MSWMRPLGQTGIEVSALGLGTVKLGRDEGVKYPDRFTIPDDRAARALLHQALDLGINLIDTAPAYGNSEERLGQLIPRADRERWVICSKVGEEFVNGESHFDFSAQHTRDSVLRSLRRLNTNHIEMVLIHSDGHDLDVLRDRGALDSLRSLQQSGEIGAYGISTKTVEGGELAALECDLVMLTYNLGWRTEEPVLEACARQGKGTLIKKALASGHLADTEDPVAASMALVLGHPATGSAVVGTINPEHLAANVAAARRVTGD